MNSTKSMCLENTNNHVFLVYGLTFLFPSSDIHTKKFIMLNPLQLVYRPTEYSAVKKNKLC